MRLRDFVYPPRCLCCFKVIKTNALTCDECKSKLESSVNFVDYHAVDFDCISLYRYTDCIRGAMNNVKYRKSLTITKKIGKMLAEQAQKLHAKTPFDLVVYVPMTKLDLCSRGFNQGEVFVKVISKHLKLKFIKKVVKKIRQTQPQKKLTAKQREKNLKGAFKVCKDVKGKNILLVDDVVTTGSTLRENVRVLYKAGANKVTAITFAKV